VKVGIISRSHIRQFVGVYGEFLEAFGKGDEGAIFQCRIGYADGEIQVLDAGTVLGAADVIHR